MGLGETALTFRGIIGEGGLMEQCRICGRYLLTGVQGWPQPLLPGDIPAVYEVCEDCIHKSGPFPDGPYTPSWAAHE